MSTFNESVIVIIKLPNGEEKKIGVMGETFLTRPDDYERAVVALLNIALIGFKNVRVGHPFEYGMSFVFREEN